MDGKIPGGVYGLDLIDDFPFLLFVYEFGTRTDTYQLTDALTADSGYWNRYIAF